MKKRKAWNRFWSMAIILAMMWTVLCGCGGSAASAGTTGEETITSAEQYFAKRRSLETDSAPYSMEGVREVGGIKLKLPMYNGEKLGKLPLSEPNCAASCGIFFAQETNRLFILTGKGVSYICSLPRKDGCSQEITEIPTADSNVVFFQVKNVPDDYSMFAETSDLIYRYYVPEPDAEKGLSQVLDLNSGAFRKQLDAFQGEVLSWRAVTNNDLVFTVRPMAAHEEDSDAYRDFLNSELVRLADNSSAQRVLTQIIHGDSSIRYRPMIAYNILTGEMNVLYSDGEKKSYIESISNEIWQPDPLPDDPVDPMPEVKLEGPVGMKINASTINNMAYVDKNGVLHYSTLTKKTLQQNLGGRSPDVPDGTKNVKAIADARDGLFVLKNNGTMDVSLNWDMDNWKPYEDTMDPRPYIRKEMQQIRKLTGIDMITSCYAYSYTPTLNSLWAFNFDAKDHNRIVNQLDGWKGLNDIDLHRIVQVAHDAAGGGVAFLYSDGTIGLTDQQRERMPVDITQKWTDIVQIGMMYNLLVGLREDGVLLTAVLDEKDLRSSIDPAYTSYVQRIFYRPSQALFIQLSDGTVYDPANEKNLGRHELMDQILTCGYDHVIGVDKTGKVHCLTSGPADEWVEWACSLTDVKTVWDD